MRYRILGPTGLRVSSLVLGTGNFGTGWGYGTPRDEARRIYDRYRDAGGNFIDTADQYQFGQSEAMLGDFMRGSREELVLATKFALGDSAASGLQRTGNSRKAMFQSVEASLRRLQTDRIDLLWVHMPDGVTPMEEILRGFEQLAREGKILYAGLSDFPAWRVAAACTLARERGTLPIAAVQLEYSLVERTAERELLPMAAAFGLGVVGWSPLSGGLLTGKYRQGETGRAQGLGAVVHGETDARKTATVDAVLQVAQATGWPASQVAMAWATGRDRVTIVGPRTAEQLADHLQGAARQLAAEHTRLLEAASAIAPGFPHEIVAASAGRLAGGQAERIDAPARPVW